MCILKENNYPVWQIMCNVIVYIIHIGIFTFILSAQMKDEDLNI